MKFIDGIVITEVGGKEVLVALGHAAMRFQGMVKLNDTAAFLAHLIDKGTTEQQMLDALLETYDVDEERARGSIDRVVTEFGNLGILA